MPYIIKNVKAHWPKINKCYVFSEEANQSVPCDPKAQGAQYRIDFTMTKEQAQELHTAMKAVWAEKFPDENFPNNMKSEDGMFKYHASIKGSYSGEAVDVPRQFDAGNKLYPKDFQLTHGSTVNIAVNMSAWSNPQWSGVSCRLTAVQVLELASASVGSPFGVEGKSDQEENPFEAEPVAEAPKKKVARRKTKKATEQPSPKVDATQLNGGIAVDDSLVDALDDYKSKESSDTDDGDFPAELQ